MQGVPCELSRGPSKRKTFHYAWLLLSIMLVAWDLPEDNQFPPLEAGLPEAAKFASLYATNPTWVTETNFFWVLMELRFLMVINQCPWLSLTMYEQLSKYVEFKVDFHRIYIRARKDPQQKWFDLPYLVTEDAI